MKNLVLTLLLAVLVVLTGLTVRRSLFGTAGSGADRRTSLVAIGGSPIPIPPPPPPSAKTLRAR